MKYGFPLSLVPAIVNVARLENNQSLIRVHIRHHVVVRVHQFEFHLQEVNRGQTVHIKN